MVKYKRTTAKNGRSLYFMYSEEKNRYMIHSEAKIPLAVRTVWNEKGDAEVEYDPELIDAAELDDETLDEKTPDTASLEQVSTKDADVCLVCGKPAVTQRAVNQQVVKLCEEHRNMTLGSVAEVMRHKNLI